MVAVERRVPIATRGLGHRHTGELVAEATGLPVRLLLSGPRGGDAQIAAMIARGELDMVVFLWDPLVTHAHAPDVQSLIRLAVVHNVAIACNRRSADLMMSSRLLDATAPSAQLCRPSATSPPTSTATPRY